MIDPSNGKDADVNGHELEYQGSFQGQFIVQPLLGGAAGDVEAFLKAAFQHG